MKKSEAIAAVLSDQKLNETQTKRVRVPDSDIDFGVLREAYRHFKDYQKARTRLQNQIFGIVWRETKCTRPEVKPLIKKLFPKKAIVACSNKDCEKPIVGGTIVSLASMDERYRRTWGAAVLFVEGRELFAKREAFYEDTMTQTIASSEIWEWAQNVRGIGLSNLSQVLAETGDLRRYSGPAKVWKRMGVGLVDDGAVVERQRRCKDKRLAEIHGYNPRRHAVVWNVAQSLLYQNDGIYRQILNARKDYESARHKGCKFVRGKANASCGRCQARAMRYMVKRFLRDLWTAWHEIYADYGYHWEEVEVSQ